MIQETIIETIDSYLIKYGKKPDLIVIEYGLYKSLLKELMCNFTDADYVHHYDYINKEFMGIKMIRSSEINGIYLACYKKDIVL